MFACFTKVITTDSLHDFFKIWFWVSLFSVFSVASLADLPSSHENTWQTFGENKLTVSHLFLLAWGNRCWHMITSGVRSEKPVCNNNLSKKRLKSLVQTRSCSAFIHLLDSTLYSHWLCPFCCMKTNPSCFTRNSSRSCIMVINGTCIHTSVLFKDVLTFRIYISLVYVHAHWIKPLLKGERILDLH